MTPHHERDIPQDSGYLSRSSRVFAYNKMLIGILVVLLILKIWDSYTLSKLSEGWEQTIIPPAAAERQWVVGRSHVNEFYLIDMVHYIVNLWGNVTPITVNEKYNILLSLFHEKQYPLYKERLAEIESEIARFSTISHFMDLKPGNPIKIKENTITVSARRYKVTGSTVQPPIDVTLVIDFVIEGGRFKIVNLEEN